MALVDGDMLPDRTLQGADGALVRLADFVGKPLVVYFYPKDDTTGCTREAQDFTTLMPEFAEAGVAVLGVSKDSPKSHAKFTSKYALTVPLASDEDGVLLDDFGVWVEKSMYGRTYMGIERATFLFGADGELVRVWRKVKVPGHAQQVLDAALAL